MTAFEYNFDGLIGPTHNYGGLSVGNIASTKNSEQTSNPKKAALQGLSKMKFLMDLGIKQAVLPPQVRPHLHTLKQLGFVGTDAEILRKAYETAPYLIRNCSSASAMWTANAGTVSPSADCKDGLLHFTPANLANKFHRSIEHETTKNIFDVIFGDKDHFKVHPSLPTSNQFGDEGAANHTRLCESYDDPGLEIFVFGKYAFHSGKPKPKYFPARQTFEASQAVARLHNIKPGRTFFAQQNPIAIDGGVFHNDVISVGNQNVLLYHEHTFFNSSETTKKLQEAYNKHCGGELCLIKVTNHELTIKETVHSYLFNSQLITLPDNSMALIAPSECEENRIVHKCIDRVIGNNENPISNVHYLNVRQSMNNGGGPACLRLRVTLTKEQESALKGRCILTNELYTDLVNWVEKHYLDELRSEQLADVELLIKGREALDELTQIMELGSIYEFQQE